MPISCSIIYKSYTHLNIRGTQSLVGIEYACALKCFLWFHLCKNIGKAEKYFQPWGFLGVALHCPGWFQPFQKAETMGAHHDTQLFVVLSDISFSLVLLFYCFFNKLPINFYQLTKNRSSKISVEHVR